MRTVPFLGLIARALGDGTRVATRTPSTTGPTSTRVTIEAHGSVPYQVDGDYLGEIDRLELRHHPDAMRLVMP